jgi:hypothetical protein
MGIDMEQYLDEILAELDSVNFFDRPFIARPIIVDCLIKVMTKKLETTGEFLLNEQDLSEAYDEACSIYISDAIQQNLEDGLIKISGIDPNGELTYDITELGEEFLNKNHDAQMVKVRFQSIGDPFDPICLN